MDTCHVLAPSTHATRSTRTRSRIHSLTVTDSLTHSLFHARTDSPTAMRSGRSPGEGRSWRRAVGKAPRCASSRADTPPAVRCLGALPSPASRLGSRCRKQREPRRIFQRGLLHGSMHAVHTTTTHKHTVRCRQRNECHVRGSNRVRACVRACVRPNVGTKRTGYGERG